ncbi:penicillin-binding protein activator [Henriciella litoralis]|uniref:penicillin-binding protein activator n=1 Tax=Henriciella litoralis TaxID=568102 RepID=UPI0009FDCDE0|nr:penicillin-binding protein activator [Henriciella litoralis]
MTFLAQSRFAGLAPSLVFAAFLAMAGCATGGNQPPAPISTGNTRVDPRPQPPTPDESDELSSLHDGTDLTDFGNLEPEKPGVFTPEFMTPGKVVRAAVLLPFSHPNSGVRAEAEGMLAGIEMALFDHGGDNFLLLPKDTSGSQSTTLEVAEEAREEGANIFLGPLFGANISALNKAGLGADTQIIGFSNDRDVAGGNTWLASITPEEEVAALVNYAMSKGYRQFAFFGPQSALGTRIETALRYEANKAGARVAASGFYPTSTTSPNSEATYVAKAINSAQQTGGPVAVLIPERGTQLRRVAPLLAYYGMSRSAKMMGLSDWDDDSVFREPSLRGSWFVAPPKSDLNSFATRYNRIYGRAPSSLAAEAYDAAALAIQLAADGKIEREELMAPDGFYGMNGLFRFTPDGTTQRRLSIYEISPSGASEIKAAEDSFDPGIG